MYTEKKAYGQDPTQVVRSKTKFYDPLKWQRAGKAPALCFTCSWSDFFIEQADEWRAEAWRVIRATPETIYQILTKRIENVRDRLPADWGAGYKNVWLGVSAENQEYAERRIPQLLQLPAALRWASCEPLLGEINLRHLNYAATGWPHYSDGCVPRTVLDWQGAVFSFAALDWVVIGGESGSGAREMQLLWARNLVRQCQTARVPVFVKQLGAHPIESGQLVQLAERRHGGRMEEWPEDLQVRQWPQRIKAA